MINESLCSTLNKDSNNTSYMIEKFCDLDFNKTLTSDIDFSEKESNKDIGDICLDLSFN